MRFKTEAEIRKILKAFDQLREDTEALGRRARAMSEEFHKASDLLNKAQAEQRDVRKD